MASTSKNTDDLETTESNLEFVFRRFIDYLNKNDINNAKFSAISDIQKFEQFEMNGLGIAIIMNSKNSDDLIKAIAGFHFVEGTSFKQYYKNPQKAIEDYSDS